MLHFSWSSVTVYDCAPQLFVIKYLLTLEIFFLYQNCALFHWGLMLLTWIALCLLWAECAYMDSYLAVIFCNSNCTVHSRLPRIQKPWDEILLNGKRNWEFHKFQKHSFILIFFFWCVRFWDLACFNFSSVVKYMLRWPYFILNISSNRK